MGGKSPTRQRGPGSGQVLSRWKVFKFQASQGHGGSFTHTWGSSYEFSAGLPQPTLRTTAGQTDMLDFIYNAAKGTCLLAAFVNGFD